MTEFGVSVYVEMRAPEWVANSHRITSPVVPLEQAVALRSRLLRARSTSWELLHAEWVELLQGGRISRSLEEAESHVRQARRGFLEQQLPHAVKNAERALDVLNCLVSKKTSCDESKKKSRVEKEVMQTTR